MCACPSRRHQSKTTGKQLAPDLIGGLAPYGGAKNAVRKDSLGENRTSSYQQIQAKKDYLPNKAAKPKL